MELWLDFLFVGFAALILFIVCAFYEKRLSDAPRLLLVGILAGTPLGLLSDVALRGTYSYPLGYGIFYLILNAAVVYGFFTATVLLLQRTRLLRFCGWIVGMILVYEITNYFFPVWNYEVTPLLGWIAFVIVGFFATAIFIVLVAHLFLGYKFRFIDTVIK